MTTTNTPSKPATGRRRYDPKPVPAGQPEAANPAEPVLTGMAAQAAAFQAANPDLKLVLIPLRDGGTPKLEGKVPIPDNWEQSEGVPFDHPSWRKATGYGLVLTGNQEVVIFDIDGKLSKKARKALDQVPGLRYKTKQGFHLICRKPATAKLASMNSLKHFGSEHWGQIFHWAERQVALTGSKNKLLPEDGNLTIPSAPFQTIKTAIDTLLAQKPADTEQTNNNNNNGKKGSRHNRLLAAIQEAYRAGTFDKQTLRTIGRATPEYASLKETGGRNAPKELEDIILWVIQNVTPDAPRDAAAYTDIINKRLPTCGDEHGRLWAYNKTGPAAGSYTHERAEEAATRQIRRIAEEHKQPVTLPILRTTLLLLKANELTINLTNPDLIAVRNGTLNLTTLILTPHSPQHRLPTSIPTDYKPEAEATLWNRVLKEIIPDEEDRLLLQCYTGACLPDQRPPKGAVFILGEPDSGKSVITGTITDLLGTWNITSVPPQALARPHMSDTLRGKKANIVGDMSLEAMKDPSYWKMITGEDPVLFNPKNKTPSVGYVTTPSLYAMNAIPQTYDKTGAVAIRRHILKTGGTIPPNDRDPGLRKRLQEQQPGILNWAIEGLRWLQKNGWNWPKADHRELQQTEAILAEHPVRDWAQSEVKTNIGGFITTEQAIQAHIQWLIDKKLLDKPDPRYDQDGHPLEVNPRLPAHARNRILSDLDDIWGNRVKNAEGTKRGWRNKKIVTPGIHNR